MTTRAASAPSPGRASSPSSRSRSPWSSPYWLTNHSGDRGSFPVYLYVQAVYLLPYAVLAVPVATSAFPFLAASSGAGDDTSATLARALRAVLVLTGLSAGVLVAVAPAVGAFFTVLDARRGVDGASPAALAAMPGALTAYAPGLVGFGLTALLTRALYVRGRPMDAGIAAALGWAVAGLLPLLLIGAGQGPAATLRGLGLASTLGMTISGSPWWCSCGAPGGPSRPAAPAARPEPSSCPLPWPSWWAASSRTATRWTTSSRRSSSASARGWPR